MSGHDFFAGSQVLQDRFSDPRRFRVGLEYTVCLRFSASPCKAPQATINSITH